MNESILVVEDNLEMAHILRKGLEHETYRVTMVHDGAVALEMLRSQSFAAVILDIMLPGLDGIALTRALRAEGDTTPILALTARDALADVVAGLDAGAEDYLIKPFSFSELLARVRSLLRRWKPASTVLRVNNVVMDTGSHTVMHHGVPIPLTKTEFLVLGALMRQPGQLVARREIMRSVWGSISIEEKVIESHVKGLRQKLERGGAAHLIRTVRGFGYMLIKEAQ